LVVGTMILPTLAVLAGGLCLLFFVLFTRFYFRNRREAMELRDRLAVEAETPAAGKAVSGMAPLPDAAATATAEGATGRAADGGSSAGEV
jgi:hypothetical protein